MVHIYNGILLSHKEEWNTICSHMHELKAYHTKFSMSKISINIICYHLYVKPNCFFERYKWTYLQNRKKLINIENNLVVTEEETWDWGWGGGGIRSLGLTYIYYYT